MAQRTTFKHIVRLLVVGAILLVPICCLLISPVGGQSSDSPDGRYRIDISREMDPEPNDPYEVTLVEIATEKTISQMAIHPVDGFPNQGPRDDGEMIEWDAGSRFADVTFDGKLMYRVYVP